MRLLVFVFLLPIVCLGQRKIQVQIYPSDPGAKLLIHKLAIPETTSDSVSASVLFENIIETCKNKGYLTASIDTFCVDSSSVSGFFRAGMQFKDGDIDISHIAPEALAAANFKKRKTKVTATEFIRKRSDIISFYENNGYPFAALYLDSISVATDKVSAQARLEKHAPVKIEFVEITGDVKMSIDYVCQHVGISPGARYDEKAISTINEAINELNFAEMDGNPRVLFEKVNAARIIIPLRKRTANKFDGLIGFAPDANNDNKLVVTGQVTLDLNNILGLGENIALDWQKIDAYSQKLSAEYSIRYILGSKLGNDFAISLHKKDSTYLNTDIHFAIPYYLAYNKLVKLFVENKSSTILTLTTSITSSDVLDYSDVSTNLVGAGVKFWQLDYFFNPRRGYFANIEFASGKKKIAQNSTLDPELYKDVKLETSHIEVRQQAGVYVPITRRTVLFVEDKAALMESETLLYNELFLIGGTKSLRGFNESEIPCSRYGIVNTEYRFLFQKNSNVYLFWNGGYYENRASKKFVCGYPYGLGCGLNLQSKQSIFTISYAVGTHWGNQLRLNSAKIHFGYINKF